MRIPKILMPNRLWRVILFLGPWLFITGTYVQAQTFCATTQGLNAVFGPCNSTGTQGSIAMVDAKQFSGDICSQIQASFAKYLSSGNNYGVVVDARGIGSGTTQMCTGQSGTGGNPWANWTAGSLPSVVLLPSGTIQISSPWTMPQLARLIGEGPGVTIVQATASMAAMIEIGSNSSSICATDPNGTLDCPGVAIEHLGLNGNNESGIDGIVNGYGQELSYVQDVAFLNIPGTALSLQSSNSGNSQNSGPYSNLTMSNVGTCVSINGTLDTRGIHGLTCTTSPTSTAAISLEASNNSLEDISLYGTNTSGTTYGISIGDSNKAQNNVLFNIRGSGFTNLIYLSGMTGVQGGTQGVSNCPGQVNNSSDNNALVNNVCDITIMGVTKLSGTNTIFDQVDSVTLTDPNLGMYILGEPVQSGPSGSTSTYIGNSHFTTSPKWPTWVVGSSQQQGNACPSVGSLYSVTSGSAPTLLECEETSSGAKWAMVK